MKLSILWLLALTLTKWKVHSDQRLRHAQKFEQEPTELLPKTVQVPGLRDKDAKMESLLVVNEIWSWQRRTRARETGFNNVSSWKARDAASLWEVTASGKLNTFNRASLSSLKMSYSFSSSPVSLPVLSSMTSSVWALATAPEQILWIKDTHPCAVGQDAQRAGPPGPHPGAACAGEFTQRH